MSNNRDMSVPSNVKVRIFDENDYAEYEKVTGKRIRDLNKQRNFMVETVKKEWKQNKAWHYRLLDQNPFYKEYLVPSTEPILPPDIEVPIVQRKQDERFQTKLKKMRAKAALAINERYMDSNLSLRKDQKVSRTYRV